MEALKAMDRSKLGFWALMALAAAILAYLILSTADERAFKDLVTQKYEKKWGQYLSVANIDIKDAKVGRFIGRDYAEVDFKVDLVVRKSFTGCVVVSSSSFCMKEGLYKVGVLRQAPSVNFMKYKSGWQIE